MTPASDLQGNDPRPMDFRFLFLEPQGRLAPKPFGRGLVLLTGGGMIISVLTAVVSPGLNVLQYALVFPYICLFGKRLHDAGLTAWLWIAFLAGLGFLNMFLSAMLLPVLSPEVSTALYRACQEAVNNAVKYSGADLLEVTLSATPELSMVISDTGKGFDAATVQRGKGMANIPQRCSRAGFTAVCTSAPGKGCTWRIRQQLPEQVLSMPHHVERKGPVSHAKH